ncbi:rhizopine catabolism transcriptional regulator MocR [Lichenifustis flavocetrariae]|uniref:PLP-dependent aminotransferase family protein n=1 Tax=Lichenifustis flavocetrariae TaxID=2949735 RepID=A0AA42CLR8_9HYPH|nr:PLP-dependent aminotransferase family protein [Lichenifustis flavocetrariae]MCW6511838.1 PLP-dependent aminotransferase family protein [Lichenifustis flavocetrariae]
MAAEASFPLDALRLDRSGSVALHRQLYQALRLLIIDRALPPGSALPSTRAMALDLALARNTVTAAYDQLTAEGYLLNRPGARPRVVDLPTGVAKAATIETAQAHQPLSRRGSLMARQPVHHGEPGRMIFHPGMPDADYFPFGTWSRLLSRRASHAGETLFGTYDVAGHPALRRAIAAYLKAARGVLCAPEQIVVTTGAQAALDLLARLLLDPGDAVWMEEPGYYGAQSAFVAAGAKLLPLDVDAGGWALDPPAHQRLRLVYVTPSCQHPLGATMRMEQRLRLLEIAENRGAWIIEDDFDGEYRFQGQPIPAMQGADRSQRVIYLGTFAKILFPALRVGFMVLPHDLVPGVTRAISITGQFAPLLLQAALADFIEQGHMARHLRRMRRIYAQRRQVFRTLWEARLSEWGQLGDGEAGIQILGVLNGGLDDVAISATCRSHGVNVSPLSIQYRHGPGCAGLLIGYAAANEATTRQGLLCLEAAFRSHDGAASRPLALSLQSDPG